MESEKQQRKKERLVKWRTNLVWIIVVFIGVYIFGCSLLYIPFDLFLEAVEPYVSDGLLYIMYFYTSTIFTVLGLFLLTWLVKPSRYIWKSFLLPKKRAAAETDESDILADYYGRRRNGLKMLGWGLLIGFAMNFIAILCALIHGDIQLYFESSAGQIPLFLFAFISVFIQSSSEELWCRGFLYCRIHERYPLWVAVLTNGILFGALHLFNTGVTAFSVIEITTFGISFSLLRWYTGNIWIVMGVHTAWNFMQAFLFGLPNSGLVSELSLFHLEASNGVSNMIYNFEFGVEGCLPTLLLNLLVAAIVLVLAVRSGRLKELKMNRKETMAASAGR